MSIFFVYFQRKYGIDIHVQIPAGKSKNFQSIFTKFSFSVMPMGGGKFPRLPPFPTPMKRTVISFFLLEFLLPLLNNPTTRSADENLNLQKRKGTPYNESTLAFDSANHIITYCCLLIWKLTRNKDPKRETATPRSSHRLRGESGVQPPPKVSTACAFPAEAHPKLHRDTKRRQNSFLPVLLLFLCCIINKWKILYTDI